jgi:oxalate---CoA ligase
MRVVAECGGVVNTSSKDFWEAYEKVLVAMSAANQPTSLPMGSHPDKRTLWKVLDRLIERGKLKVTTATVVPHLVQRRIAKLIYDPMLPQEQLDSFIIGMELTRYKWRHRLVCGTSL